MRDLDLETLFQDPVFLVSSVLGWEIRVVRWIRRREAVRKNVPFRDSEIGRSSSFLAFFVVLGPPRFACRAGFRVRAARGGSGVALAPLCGSRDAPSILDLGLRVGAVWGFARFSRRLVERAGLTGVLRDRGTSCHPRPGGKIFILFPVISSIRQITFIRNTGPGEKFLSAISLPLL